MSAEGLTQRNAVGYLLMILINFQTFISRHNINFVSDYRFLTSVYPASSVLALHTTHTNLSKLCHDSLTVNAGLVWFLYGILMVSCINAAHTAVLLSTVLSFALIPQIIT